MSRATTKSHWALVLAGGDGTRLQEFTRRIAGAPIPKQYCRIVGERSLLETTLDRIQLHVPNRRSLVIVNRDHLALASAQLRGLPPENVLVQPLNRDTGPGLLFALLRLVRRDAEAIVSVFPSDHYVADDSTFMRHVEEARRLVRKFPEKLAVLGIRPDRPDPGFGYIAPAQRIDVRRKIATFHVDTFHEKPTAELAERLLAQGGLWNSFVMVFHVRRMLQLLRRLMPQEFKTMHRWDDDPHALTERYRMLAPWNFSNQCLARVPEHLLVVRVEGVHWSDWGTVDSILRTLTLLDQSPPWTAAPTALEPGGFEDLN